jgi:hypothetical protein
LKSGYSKLRKEHLSLAIQLKFNQLRRKKPDNPLTPRTQNPGMRNKKNISRSIDVGSAAYKVGVHKFTSLQILLHRGSARDTWDAHHLPVHHPSHAHELLSPQPKLIPFCYRNFRVLLVLPCFADLHSCWLRNRGCFCYCCASNIREE